jgi:hypothetical protein
MATFFFFLVVTVVVVVVVVVVIVVIVVVVVAFKAYEKGVSSYSIDSGGDSGASWCCILRH